MPRNGAGVYTLPAGNPVVSGSPISSTVQNATMTDVAAALSQSISADGQTSVTANLPMAGFRHTGVSNGVLRTDYSALGQLQDSAPQWLSSVSGTDTIAATATPALSAYAAGQTFRFVSAGVNTTNAVTLNIGGLGAKSVTRPGGAALSAGDIPAGALVEVSYDGTQFQVVGLAAATANSAPGSTAFGSRNVLINSNFGRNQMGVSGTVTLAAGNYGHDMWKAGSGGCAYTFSTVDGVTTITITAGTLQQVIEGEQLQSGIYTLSWGGTAQARIDSGSYGASGITGTALGGANQTVEFGTGTVRKPQYEPGSVKTPWAPYAGIYGGEVQACERYVQTSAVDTNGLSTSAGSVQFRAASTVVEIYVPFRTRMRATPSVSLYSPATGVGAVMRDVTGGADYAASVADVGQTGAYFQKTALGTSGNRYAFHWIAFARL